MARVDDRRAASNFREADRAHAPERRETRAGPEKVDFLRYIDDADYRRKIDAQQEKSQSLRDREKDTGWDR